MEELIARFISLVDGFKLLVLFGLIAIDTALGLFGAILNRTFQWVKIADFLNTSVMGLVAGYYLVGLFAALKPEFALIVPATWALIDAKLVADIVNKLKRLGVPG